MSCFAVICVLCLGGNLVKLWGKSVMLIWEGIYEVRIGIHKTEPVSPLMGSEAPYCGGGLWGNCLLIIHFIF